MSEMIRRFSEWFRQALLQKSNGMPSGATAEETTSTHTEQGIAAAMERAEGSENIAAGTKVCRINDDVIGLLVSNEGKFGYVRFDPGPKAQPHKVKMCEIFDAELANKLAHAYRAADQQTT